MPPTALGSNGSCTWASPTHRCTRALATTAARLLSSTPWPRPACQDPRSHRPRTRRRAQRVPALRPDHHVARRLKPSPAPRAATGRRV